MGVKTIAEVIADRDKHRAIAAELGQRNRELHRQLDLQERIFNTPESEFWVWMDGVDNELETMSDDMVVKITARQLRQLARNRSTSKTCACHQCPRCFSTNIHILHDDRVCLDCRAHWDGPTIGERA